MDMTFSSYLLQLSFNLLSSTIPTALVIYFCVRLAVRQGLADAAKAVRPAKRESE